MRFVRKSWWRSLSPEAQATLIKGAISLIGFGAYVGLVVYVAKKEGRGLNLHDLVKIIEHIPNGDETFRFKPDEDLTRRLLTAVSTPPPTSPGGPVIEGEVVEEDVLGDYIEADVKTTLAMYEIMPPPGEIIEVDEPKPLSGEIYEL